MLEWCWKATECALDASELESNLDSVAELDDGSFFLDGAPVHTWHMTDNGPGAVIAEIVESFYFRSCKAKIEEHLGSMIRIQTYLH
jgi:hypothetical protein